MLPNGGQCCVPRQIRYQVPPRLCGLGCLARALFPALCYTFCYAESGLRGSVEVNRSKELAKKKGLSVDMAGRAR